MPGETSLSGNVLGDFLCFSIYSAGHAFNQLYRTLLDDLGLTYPQYLVMSYLWDADNKSLKEIGAALELESNTLTPMLKRLEGMNLLVRCRDKQDERLVRIQLTKAGRDLKSRADQIPPCVLEATGLTADELTDLIQKINTVKTHVKAFSNSHTN
ncbi:MAG: MarR family transcriptional regulator [Cyanobacteria bacterium P01_A01_bin.123]